MDRQQQGLSVRDLYDLVVWKFCQNTNAYSADKDNKNNRKEYLVVCKVSQQITHQVGVKCTEE